MCVKPINIRLKQVAGNGNIMTQPVPCGRCPECRKAKTKSWLFRIKKELERSSNPLFVTLTYTDDNLPYTENGEETLNKKDVQDFMKRLRKAHALKSTSKLVYYCVGEYGTKYGRPHYHMILLNLDNENLIDQSWGNGFVYNPKLNIEKGGISYVLKYISKPINYGKSTTRQREFSLVSKGIGSNYLTRATIAYHQKSTSNAFLREKGGYTSPLPKYYKEKIYDSEMRSEVTLHLKQRSKEKEERLIAKIHQLNPTWNVNEVLNYIENSKFNKTFDKRIKDVL